MNPGTPLKLAGTTLTLFALLVVEYGHSRPQDDTRSTVPIPSSPAIPARTQAAPAADTQARVNGILARPLFAATRRPPSAAPIAAKGPPALPRLTAVLVSGRGKTVIFAGGPDKKPVSLGEGGRIGAYVVQSIDTGQATLLGPEGVRVLRPIYDGAALGAATSAAAAAPPPTLDPLRQAALSLGIPGLAQQPANPVLGMQDALK